jgi:hypothetical protein
MVLYNCLKCLKIFNKKCDFTRHNEHRKTPCFVNIDNNKKPEIQPALFALSPALFALSAPKPALFALSAPIIKQDKINKNNNNKKIVCEHCDTSFTRNSSLIRHYSTCTNNKNIVEQLKVENEKLKIENEKLNNTIIKPIIINNSTVNNNININIVNYGEEDLSKLDLKKILKYDNSFIEMVFRDIHCNSELPENQNILLPSLTRYDIYIKLNNEWLKRNKKEILTERYTTIRTHIMDLYDKESEINKGKADNTYFHFLKQIKLIDPSNTIYKPQEEKKIIEGMSNVLYNHKNNIKSIIKASLIKQRKKEVV